MGRHTCFLVCLSSSTVFFRIYASRTSAFLINKFIGKSHPSQPSESHQQPEINRISTKIKHLETTSSLLHRPPYLTSQCLPHTLNHNHTSPHLLLKNTTSSHHSRSQHTHARCTNTPKSRWKPPLDQHGGGAPMPMAQTRTAD